MRNLRFTLAAIVFAAPAFAQSSSRQLADDPRVAQALTLAKVWLQAQRDFDQIPGLSAAIVHDQHTVWSGGFGYADVVLRTPATASTIYSICSISKLFTSIGVLQQRDAGKLRLDDPVAKHLSWFNIKRAHPDFGEATIEGLLTHASGLPRESDYPYWSGPDFAFPTREQIIAKLASQETLYPTETYFQYSNLGLTLAGEILSTVTGEPYDQYVTKRILEPLGLSSTRTDMPAAERGRRLATGYSAITRDGNRRPVPLFVPRGITPAAGFSSTAEDLAKFAQWQFRVLSGSDKAGVLAMNTLREMQRVHFVDPSWSTTYGLGFAVTRDSGGRTFVGHGGSCPGYRTDLITQPREKIAIVTMANAQGVNTGQLAQRLYDIAARKDRDRHDGERAGREHGSTRAAAVRHRRPCPARRESRQHETQATRRDAREVRGHLQQWVRW
jgi:CubicO group peptidase (beta-lactamase class C family)